MRKPYLEVVLNAWVSLCLRLWMLARFVQSSIMATVIKVNQSASHRKEPKPQGRPPHHVDDNHTRFTNPWDSWPSVFFIPFYTTKLTDR